jgi:hypothetical protein
MVEMARDDEVYGRGGVIDGKRWHEIVKMVRYIARYMAK